MRPDQYDQPRPVSRYDRVMGAIVNNAFAVLIFLTRA